MESADARPKWRTLAAGASAGLVVDTSLYPVDTIKSRLQSKPGFLKSGGFKHLYRGLPPVLIGSIPNAAVFFITYETIKDKLHQHRKFESPGRGHIFGHMLAASAGEVVSCLVRVPYEVVKTQSQLLSPSRKLSNMAIARGIITSEGYKGLYRGFSSTVIRDLPFSAIQYPIWENLKARHLDRHKRPVTAGESAYYGAIAGAVAALITNPLDVAKTWIMSADNSDTIAKGNVLSALRAIKQERGMAGLFAGVLPRVVWISVGAAIFLGTYEKTLGVLS